MKVWKLFPYISAVILGCLAFFFFLIISHHQSVGYVLSVRISPLLDLNLCVKAILETASSFGY